MKNKLKIPNLPLWGLAAVCALLALIPADPYIRVMPAGLALIFTAYGLLFALERKKPRQGKALRMIFSALVTVFFLVVSITGVCIICQGAVQPEHGCEYIVVLGAKVKDSGPTASLKERIDCAYEYLTENPDAVAIVSGGRGENEPVSEAQCMYEELTAMGIAPERIWIEDRASSTWENLRFSLALIEEKTGSLPDKVGIVTSEYHQFRAGLHAREQGLDVVAIPARTGNPMRWLAYFVREVAGVWHYLILGGLYD